MPHVSREDRRRLDAGGNPHTKGELAYCIARSMVAFVNAQSEHNYLVLSNASGAARDVANDWDRRVLGPYEDAKARGNGSAFEPLGQ